MFLEPMENEPRRGERAMDWDIGENSAGFTRVRDRWEWGSSLGQLQKQRPDGKIASLPGLNEGWGV